MRARSLAAHLHGPFLFPPIDRASSWILDPKRQCRLKTAFKSSEALME